METKKKSSAIIRNDLSTLLKRFAKSDVVNTISDEYQTNYSSRVPPALIDDNKYLMNTQIDEKKLSLVLKSISEKNILNPLIVRLRDERYELISGKKRLEAAKRLNLSAIPVIIHQLNDENMLVYMLFSMRNSRETNAIEIALLCKALVRDFHYTQQQIAMIMDISRPQVTNLMRLLNLPNQVLMDISSGKLSYGHARSLIACDEKTLEKILKEIYEKNLSVHETERLMQQHRKTKHINSAKTNSLVDIKVHNMSVTLTFAKKTDLINFLKKEHLK